MESVNFRGTWTYLRETKFLVQERDFSSRGESLNDHCIMGDG